MGNPSSSVWFRDWVGKKRPPRPLFVYGEGGGFGTVPGPVPPAGRMEQRMQKRRAIREKLLLGALLVGVMVAVLSASSFLGVYSYRRLVRALSSRAAELPRASELGECVGLLRR